MTDKTVGGLSLYPQRNRLDRDTALRMWTEKVTWFSNEEGNLAASVEAVHFQVGNSIRNAGGRNADYVGMELKFGW